MKKVFRKTIDFHRPALNRIVKHGQERGCGTFAETVRDIIRLYFDSKNNNRKEGISQNENNQNFTLEAQQALVQYKRKRLSSRNRNNSMSLKGVELDVVRYYLQGYLIREVIKILNKERNIRLSNSAVGRLYKGLRKAGVVYGVYPRGL